jgi:hypothetical protein
MKARYLFFLGNEDSIDSRVLLHSETCTISRYPGEHLAIVAPYDEDDNTSPFFPDNFIARVSDLYCSPGRLCKFILYTKLPSDYGY